MKLTSIIRYIIIILFIQAACAFCTEKQQDNWVIAVSEFKTENVPSAYSNYSKVVPEMFFIYLDTQAKRVIPLSEKKARAMLEVSAKRLKLVKERAKLIEEKDNLFLAAITEKEKLKKIKKLDKDILAKEKQIELASIDIKIEQKKFYAKEPSKNITLWKNGTETYKQPEGTHLANVLKNEKISALISGEIKNISGYMYIKVKLQTGLQGFPIHEFTHAGKYSEIEAIVQTICTQIYSTVQNTKEIKIYFDVTPKNAKLYINGENINDFSKPITLTEGKYYIDASAEDYISAAKEIELKDKTSYQLKINLKKENTAVLAFNIKGNPELFFRTKYYGKTPAKLKLPYSSSIIEFEKDKVHTYALIDGKRIPHEDFAQNMIVKLNAKQTKKIVETQRKVLYWSLAAFYFAFPANMILKGVYNDKKLAYDTNRLPQTEANLKNIKNLGTASSVMQGITIALGINYFIQLIVYLVNADRALPREVKADYKNLRYAEPENTEEIKAEDVKDKSEKGRSTEVKEEKPSNLPENPKA